MPRSLKLAIAALVLAPPAAASGSVLFPVVVSPRDAAEASVAPPTTLTQTVRSDGAVRITADTPIPYKPRILDRKLLGGGRGLTLTAGAVLVRAIVAGGDAYCAAVAPKAEGMMTFFDLGLCLRDTDHDGVFDQQLIFEPTQRIRTPYEISEAAALPGSLTWAPTQAPYAALAAAEIPAAKIRIRYRPTPISVKGAADVSLELCAPPELTVPGAAKSGEEVCGLLAVPGMTLRNLGDEVRFRARGGGRQTLNWGDVSVDIEGAGGNTRMSFAKAWPAGPALLGLLGAFRQTNDYKFQRSIFALAPTGVRPAAAP